MRLRLCERDAGRQAGDHVQPGTPPTTGHTVPGHPWPPQLRVRGERRAEAFRHDTDHRVGDVGERDAPPHHIRVPAEARAPCAMAEQHHVRGALHVVRTQEVAAQRRADAQHAREHRVAHLGGTQHLRLVDPRQGGLPRAPRGRGLEEPGLVTDLPERGHVEAGARAPLPARHLAPNPHEPIRLRVRQPLQQHGVHDAEDRRVRSDSHPQRSDHQEREAGRAHQPADRVVDVPNQRAHRPRRSP